jgi:hypothetical protein
VKNLEMFADPQQKKQMPKHATAVMGASAPLPSLAVDPIVAERTIFYFVIGET